jgi:hypothetical protein
LSNRFERHLSNAGIRLTGRAQGGALYCRVGCVLQQGPVRKVWLYGRLSQVLVETNSVVVEIDARFSSDRIPEREWLTGSAKFPSPLFPVGKNRLLANEVDYRHLKRCGIVDLLPFQGLVSLWEM